MTLSCDSLASLFDRYDAFLIDQFGVLLGGTGPYPGAQDALADLAKRGKPVVILSNSGKRSAMNITRLVQHGFDRDHFETVLTSGEVAHSHLFQSLGRDVPKHAKAFVIIKDGDPSPFEDLPLSRTTDPNAADILLIVNRDPSRQIADYRPILQRLAARNVPGICTNPDLKMLTPDGLMDSAGFLAQIYTDLGGDVRVFGKPHRQIYEHASGVLGRVDPKATLCIGDSLRHDIAGGAAAGFKTALVRTGIDADLTDLQLERAIDASGLVPDHVIRSFSLDH